VRKPTDVQLAIGALIAFALWIFVVLPLLYYPRQKAPQNNQGVANRQQQSKAVGDEPPTFIPLKLFVPAARNEIAEYCASTPKGEEQNWAHGYICDVKITDTYIAAFNGLLVIVTVGLIVVGSLTIRKMRDTEERQLRAYVYVENAYYEIAGSTCKITFRAKNFGLTPAHRVRVLSIVKAVDWNNGSPTVPVPTVENEEQRGSMAPNGDFVDSEAEEVTFSVLSRGKVVYLAGVISYETVFRRTRKTTHFRYYIGGDAPADVEVAKGEMNIDAEGNDAT
jgi:hypothetical protein